MKKIEEELNLLGESLKKIRENKMPPSDKCFEIMEKMVDYHEDILEDKEDFEKHLRDCLRCFDSYMEFSDAVFLAEEGKLEAPPAWVNDMGMSLFKHFNLYRRLESINSGIKDIVFIRLFKTGVSLPGPGIGVSQLGESFSGYWEKKFSFKEPLAVEISTSMEQGGYITVFHFNSDGKVTLIFPHDKDRNNFISKEETKFIKTHATLPAGQSTFKVFFTESQLFDPGKIDYNDETSTEKEIELFLESLEKLNEDYKWSAVKEDYTVTGKEERKQKSEEISLNMEIEKPQEKEYED